MRQILLGFALASALGGCVSVNGGDGPTIAKGPTYYQHTAWADGVRRPSDCELAQARGDEKGPCVDPSITPPAPSVAAAPAALQKVALRSSL